MTLLHHLLVTMFTILLLTVGVFTTLPEGIIADHLGTMTQSTKFHEKSVQYFRLPFTAKNLKLRYKQQPQ